MPMEETNLIEGLNRDLARELAWRAERATYGEAEPGADEQRRLVRSSGRLRRQARHLRRRTRRRPTGQDA